MREHTGYSTALQHRGNAGGFSLVELIAVLVVMGVLSALLAPRFFGAAPFRERGFYDELASAVRYAQRQAVATQCEVRVAIDGAADTYALHYPDDADGDPTTCDGAGAGFGGNPVTHPGKNQAFAASAPQGVGITGNLTFHYDALGEPSASGSVQVGSHSLTVEAVTGYVH